MIETVTVKEIHDDHVVVAGRAKADCKSCSSAFCSAADEFQFEVANPRGMPLRPGDRVELRVSTGRTVAAGFLVLIVPLIFFGLFYLVASRLFASEAAGAGAGLGGLALGFGLSYLAGRARKGKNIPEIVSVRNRAERRSDQPISLA